MIHVSGRRCADIIPPRCGRPVNLTAISIFPTPATWPSPERLVLQVKANRPAIWPCRRPEVAFPATRTTARVANRGTIAFRRGDRVAFVRILRIPKPEAASSVCIPQYLVANRGPCARARADKRIIVYRPAHLLAASPPAARITRKSRRICIRRTYRLLRETRDHFPPAQRVLRSSLEEVFPCTFPRRNRRNIPTAHSCETPSATMCHRRFK